LTKLDAPAKANRPAAWTEQGREFEALYRSVQKDNSVLVPPRTALTLSVLRRLAPYFRLLEILPPNTALIRILGTAIVNRTRLEHTGKNLLDSFSQETKGQSWRHFQHLLDVPCGAILRFEEEYTHSVGIEVVSFPLVDAQGVARYIGSTVVELDQDALLDRGDGAMHGRALLTEQFVDIGSGTGASR
jgi:hypothetical protein